MAAIVTHSQHNLFILTTRNEKQNIAARKQNEEARKTNLEKRKSSLKTLSSMSKKTNKLTERIFKTFDLKEQVVKNVIAYAKCLTAPGTDVIDKNIFDAQMARHFKLIDEVMLGRMYQVCSLDNRKTVVYLDEYVELICIFLTGIQDLKVQFVFYVYNARGDGYLNRRDLEYFIKPMVAQVTDNEEPDEENTWKYFVELLINVVDKNGDQQVELDEFRELAEKNVMMMQCLGPCLPSEEDRLLFLNLISDMSSIDCSALFRFERRISLSEPKLRERNGIQRFYPIDLELP